MSVAQQVLRFLVTRFSPIPRRSTRVFVSAILFSVLAFSQSSTNVVTGYFPEWQVYHGFYPSTLETNNVASHLTYLIYAFATISPAGTCQIADPQAALGEQFTKKSGYTPVANAADDVVETQFAGGTPYTVLQGNFHQLYKFKQNHPGVKILISIGGQSTDPNLFASAVQNNLTGFVTSCMQTFIQGDFKKGALLNGAPDPLYQSLPATAGIFDGFDIDWEFPTSKPAFTNLLKEFRRQLADRPLTVAIGATAEQYVGIDFPAGQGDQHGAAYYADYFNLMSYDYGSTDTTTFPAPLFPSALAQTNVGTISGAVTTLTGDGVPAGKIILGIPFYGIQWSVAGAGQNHGLFAPQASGMQKINYSDIVKISGLTKHCDYGGGNDTCPQTWGSAVSTVSAGAQEVWFNSNANPTPSSPSTFTIFDDRGSIAAKVAYAKNTGLGGVMGYDLSQDDATETLMNSVVSNMSGSTSSTGTTNPPANNPPSSNPPSSNPPSTNPPASNPQPSQNTVLYDFEDGTQSWTNTGGVFNIASSTEHYNTGIHSLAANFINYRQTYKPTGTVYVKPTTLRAGDTVQLWVYMPSTANGHLTDIMPFFMDKNWSWTASAPIPLSQLTLDAWNMVSVQIPSTAVAPFTEIGLQFDIHDLWNGTVFIDSVGPR